MDLLENLFAEAHILSGWSPGFPPAFELLMDTDKSEEDQGIEQKYHQGRILGQCFHHFIEKDFLPPGPGGVDAQDITNLVEPFLIKFFQ